MTTAIPYPNRFAEERTAAGIETPVRLAQLAGIDPDWYAHIEAGEILPTLDEFERLRAALGDLPSERIYDYMTARVIGGTHDARTGLTAASDDTYTRPDFAKFWGDLEGTGHLLVSRAEATYLERNVRPDRSVDVFLNLSCGPQRAPHINLDTVSVLRALGVSFAAGAGRLFCCGHYYRGHRHMDAATKMNDASTGRAVAWGAQTIAHWCGNCVNTYGDVERRERLRGNWRPANLPMYVFLESVVDRLGDRIPWKRVVPAKVLVLRFDSTAAHTEASDACTRILSKVPGVEIVGNVDDEMIRVADLRNADGGLMGASNAPAARSDGERKARARQDVLARRAKLADLFAARGADTIAAAHHSGHIGWSRLSSDGLAVRHPISILAAALDCGHPDRHQAAIKLGDPDAIVEQTRPMWTSWDMKEERARALARQFFEATYAAAPSQCACGGEGGCSEKLVSVDVLTGSVEGYRTAAP